MRRPSPVAPPPRALSALLLVLLLCVLLPDNAAAFFLRPSSTHSTISTSTGLAAVGRAGQQQPPKGSGNNSSSNNNKKRAGPPLSPPTPPSAARRPAWPRPRSASSNASPALPTAAMSKPTAKPSLEPSQGTGLLRRGKPATAGPTSAAANPSAAKQQPPSKKGKAAAAAAVAAGADSRQVAAGSILPPKVKPTRLIISEPKQGLWVFEQPFVLGVTDVRNRMSVLRLSDGGVAVFSPLAATPECVSLLLDLIRKERLKLSSAYLIAPSTYPEHHESLAAWREAIPEARIVSVTPRVNVIVEYLLEGEAEEPSAALPPILGNDLEMGVLQAPLLRELIVCHKASRTLLVADSGFFISETYVDSALQRWFTKSQGIYDRFVTPPFFRLGANRRTGRPLYQRALGWGFDRIVTCHADLVPMGQGKEAFREGYAHLK